LTRLLSLSFSYHYVFAVLAVALLGLGLGATLLAATSTWWHQHIIQKPTRPLHWVCWGYGLTLTAVTIVLTQTSLAHGLLGALGLALLSFLGAGLVLALVFTAAADHSRVLYAADLLGAGVGCLVSLPALRWLGANAMAFGMFYGCALSCVSALAAAFTAFYLSRWCGRPCLERCLRLRSLGTLDTLIERYGVWAVLVARLFPVISFDLISFAAGLTAMPAAGFGLATLVGMLPAAIAFSLLGDSMASANRWSLIGGAVLLGLLLASAAGMRKSTAWRRARAAYSVSEYEATGSPPVLRESRKLW
jgi:uncharacterized membrane protein YdjX (TVP38/TMEM64 family)